MTRSAVAYWVNQFNAAVATLATRTTERDTARNSLYVSGVYQSGQSWQDKDAVDLANYNSQVAATNAQAALVATWTGRANQAWGASRTWNSGESWEAAYNRVLPPAAPDVVGGSVVSSAFTATETVLMRITVDRTGYWFVAYKGQLSNTGSTGNPISTTWTMYINGGVVDSVSYTAPDPAASGDPGGAGLYAGPVLMTAGQSIEVRASHAQNSTRTMATQSMNAVFSPTQGNPN